VERNQWRAGSGWGFCFRLAGTSAPPTFPIAGYGLKLTSFETVRVIFGIGRSKTVNSVENAIQAAKKSNLFFAKMMSDFGNLTLVLVKQRLVWPNLKLVLA
jgi:hypothetical protein